MAIANETVLVEILTAANMAGLAEARVGLSGLLGSATLAAGGLGILAAAGKSMIDIAEQHAHSEANLANAIQDRNAMQQQASDPKAIANVQKAQDNLAKAEQALQLYEDKLSVQRKQLTLPQLDELRIKNDAVTAAQQKLAAATQAVSQTHQAQRYDSQVLQQQITEFIGTNRDYISSQNDVIDGYAAFVREGVPATDVQTAMNAALDISIAENIPLSQAVELLQAAESGRATGLKRLVGIQLENISATDTEAQKAKTAHDNVELVAAAYHDARKELTPFQSSLDQLSQSWETISIKDAPHFIHALTDVVNYINDHGLPALDKFTTDLDKLAEDPSWQTVGTFIQDLLGIAMASPVDIFAPLKGKGPGVGNMGQPAPADLSGTQGINYGGSIRQPASYSSAAHTRPNVMNTTINVNAAQDPYSTARQVVAQFKKITAF